MPEKKEVVAAKAPEKVKAKVESVAFEIPLTLGLVGWTEGAQDLQDAFISVVADLNAINTQVGLLITANGEATSGCTPVVLGTTIEEEE